MTRSDGERILVVEESVLVAMELEAALAERGFRAVTAGNLMAAYMILGEGRLAAALINPALPDGRGEQLARELLDEGCPTALFIGLREPSISVDLAAAMRFRKPVEPAEVVGWLEQALARRTATDQ